MAGSARECLDERRDGVIVQGKASWEGGLSKARKEDWCFCVRLGHAAHCCDRSVRNCTIMADAARLEGSRSAWRLSART